MYTNYAYGVENGLAGATGSTYNLLITGATDYTGSSGMMLKNNTSLSTSGNKGARIAQDSNDNAWLDFRTTATDGTNSLKFRMMDDTNTASISNMLELNKDGLTSTSVYGAKVGGRVKASQYYVGQADTRTPSTVGIYLGQDNTTMAYFKINKGTGTGGYTFQTTDAAGANPITNLNLKSTGVAQIPYYSQNTAISEDMTESTAVAMWDMQGNVVRGYKSNVRLRALESGLATLETNNYSGVPTKVNEVISRLNTLKVWNTSIQNLSFPSFPTTTPAPTSSPLTQYYSATTSTTITIPAGYTKMDVLVIGGGGGGESGYGPCSAGGNSVGGGGGSAGGITYVQNIPLTGGTFTYQVGTGGTGGTGHFDNCTGGAYNGTPGTNGGQSTLTYNATTIIAPGGIGASVNTGTAAPTNTNTGAQTSAASSSNGGYWGGAGGASTSFSMTSVGSISYTGGGGGDFGAVGAVGGNGSGGGGGSGSMRDYGRTSAKGGDGGNGIIVAYFHY